MLYTSRCDITRSIKNQPTNNHYYVSPLLTRGTGHCEFNDTCVYAHVREIIPIPLNYFAFFQ